MMNKYERLTCILDYVKCNACEGEGYIKIIRPQGAKCSQCSGTGAHMHSDVLLYWLNVRYTEMCLEITNE